MIRVCVCVCPSMVYLCLTHSDKGPEDQEEG